MQAHSAEALDWPERFANVVIGRTQLLIPQGDIFSLEPALDMVAYAGGREGPVGQIKQAGVVWPVYVLSPGLNLLPSCPESYRIVILMKNVEPLYGLLCEQVFTVERKTLTVHSVPPAMRTKDSPILALALCGEEVRSISSAAELNRLLPR